jgi:hypothetical protein
MTVSPILAPLLNLPDTDDVHVALAAADWASASGRSVVLVTDNLKDLPAADLLPFDVYPLHPGDVLDLVDLVNADGLSNSLKKTAADFKNPQFSLVNMLASIRSAQQFDNATLASRLQKKWGLI